MSLSTFSVFYYGQEITLDNYRLNFDEGGGELTADLNIGGYTLNSLSVEVKRAMDAAGSLSYTVTPNRTTRTITITAASAFDLLSSTGSQSSVGPWTLLGYSTASDYTSASSYTAPSACGSEYAPQFKLQDHVPTTNNKSSVDASVNKTADGGIELVSFGSERFLECNIKYINDYTQDGNVMITNASGLSAATDFMEYCITKQPIEYMADKDNRNIFQTVLLESSPGFQNGTGYKLRELYDQGLAGYYETGVLIFREVST